MTIITADYILTCDEKFTIFENSAICFDTSIKEIAPFEVLSLKYPEAEIIEAKPNSVIMPGLINLHVHLEFSANRTTLHYGDFIGWLESVIKYRDELSQNCNQECIDKTLDGMLKSGTTTIGAISSFGADMPSAVKTAMHVFYFNEILGSNPAAVDALYNDFLGRVYESLEYKSENFTPAVSIHSPYSTHPILAKKALEIAKDLDMVVSTHFMESQAERDWLDCGGGDFQKFFANFMPDAKPVNDANSYLKLFENQKVLFTHATKANRKELDYMQSLGWITHCPLSNRLLGNGRLAIEDINNLTVATDGLSSNNSLNLWDEMRGALMMHESLELESLAKKLLQAVTVNGAKAVEKNAGVLTETKDADIIMLQLPDGIKDVDALALQLILHTKQAEEIFIAGVRQPCTF